ncbi:serine/threonine protein kinase [Myxococcota bacterium]|nr:serine/threonine protein kinase [Myxococcota bacterium]MBU1896639.1 serine/threonine protein kinase [Myxococcota bacterium]
MSGARASAQAQGGSATSPFLRPGYVLNDRYTILGKLGHGGFAAVYEARDAVIKRVVAIKVLNLQLMGGHSPDEGAKILQRFELEAEAAAQIVHPNTVMIFDRGVITDRGQPFIVMERLYGHDLDVELKRGPMAPSRIHRLFLGALSALAVAHEKGVIHRDLKPSNLFISHPGSDEERMRLVDFGIARLADREEALTKAGEMFGTPHYMAPEVIEGGQPSPALDVYQMGLILVEMYTGRRVVDQTAPIAAAMAHTTQRLNLPLSLLQGPLGATITKALSRDPKARYPDAGAFLEALRALDLASMTAQIHGESISLNDYLGASETLVMGSMGRRPRRRRALALGVTAAALLLMGGAWLALRPSPPPPPQPQPQPAPLSQPLPPSPTPSVAVALAPDAAPAPAPITISVQAHPPEAQIYEGEALLGVGQHTLRFPTPTADARALSVRLRGYQPQTITITPEATPGVDVYLKRRVKKPRGPNKPPPPPSGSTGATILD